MCSGNIKYIFIMTTRYYIAELKAAFDVTGMVVGSLRRDMDLGVPRVRVNEQCSCPSTPPIIRVSVGGSLIHPL